MRYNVLISGISQEMLTADSHFRGSQRLGLPSWPQTRISQEVFTQLRAQGLLQTLPQRLQGRSRGTFSKSSSASFLH